LHEVEGVNVIDVLLSLVNLSLDPMPVEVSEEVVDVLGGDSVTAPFLDVKGEKSLVGVRPGLVYEIAQMGLEVFDQFVVQFFAEKVGWRGVSCLMDTHGLAFQGVWNTYLRADESA
jgi:hypothetical protein